MKTFLRDTFWTLFFLMLIVSTMIVMFAVQVAATQYLAQPEHALIRSMPMRVDGGRE